MKGLIALTSNSVVCVYIHVCVCLLNKGSSVSQGVMSSGPK